MGWANCGTNPDTGDEMGYAHEGVCAEEGCDEKIDHGLSYVCGDMHKNTETCQRYYCGKHLYFTLDGQRCIRCIKNTHETNHW